MKKKKLLEKKNRRLNDLNRSNCEWADLWWKRQREREKSMKKSRPTRVEIMHTMGTMYLKQIIAASFRVQFGCNFGPTFAMGATESQQQQRQQQRRRQRRWHEKKRKKTHPTQEPIEKKERRQKNVENFYNMLSNARQIHSKTL